MEHLSNIITAETVSRIGDQYAALRNAGMNHESIANVLFDMTVPAVRSTFAKYFGPEAERDAPNEVAVVTTTRQQAVELLNGCELGEAATQMHSWDLDSDRLLLAVVHAEGTTVGVIRAMFV